MRNREAFVQTLLRVLPDTTYVQLIVPSSTIVSRYLVGMKLDLFVRLARQALERKHKVVRYKFAINYYKQ